MRIDCNVTKNYLQEKERMMVSVQKLFRGCCCVKNKDKKILRIGEIENSNPQEAVKIVQEWSDKHPRVTFDEDFKKYFPMADLELMHSRDICVESVYGSKNPNVGEDVFVLCESNLTCAECWQQPIPYEVYKKLQEARKDDN